MTARVEADLFPTEDAEKLKEALLKIFPDADFKISKDRITAEVDLEKFKELCKEKSLSTLRELEEKGEVNLNKLAASAGKIALDEEFPLGTIRVIA
jgi:predicted RNA binding protein with dsRBD fold (UPF0201 family)